MSLADLLKKPNATPVYLLEVTAGDHLRKLVLYAPLPDVPTGVAAARGGAKEVVLTWNAAANATGYKIYRGTVSGSLSLIATLGNVLTTTDTTPANGTTYYYTVMATNATGDSAQSSEVNAKTWVVYDGYTRADSATTPGTAESGQTYTNRVGVSGISSNQFYTVSAAGGVYYATLDTGVSDGTFSIVLSSANANLVNETQRFYFRWSDGSNYWMIQQQNSASIELFSCVGGGFTSHGSYVATINKGDELDVVLSGQDYTIKLNGTSRITYTDGTSHNIAATESGAGSYDAGGATESRFDLFKVAA